jgi:hypothetical protein
MCAGSTITSFYLFSFKKQRSFVPFLRPLPPGAAPSENSSTVFLPSFHRSNFDKNNLKIEQQQRQTSSIIMVALIAASGKVMTAVLAFGGGGRGGPLLHYWTRGLFGSRQNSRGRPPNEDSSSSSSSSSWSGEEIIRKIRHESQIDTAYRGRQDLIKINRVIQQEADLQQQQLMMKSEQRRRQNNTNTNSGSDFAVASGNRSAGLQRTKQPHKFARRLTVQVCLSPGCIADGAAVTMEKLQALAPAHVRIQQGGCSSFCGSGPVVVTVLEELASSSSSSSSSSTGTTTRRRPILVEQKSHKRIQNDKILQLVYPTATTTANDDDFPTQSTTAATKAERNNGPPPDLVLGYDLALQGDAAFAIMDYAKAMEYYEQAVRVAFISAVELQNERDRFNLYWAQHADDHERTQQVEYNSYDEDDSAKNNVGDTATITTSTATTRIPIELEWLIRARRNEARCKLEVGNGADIEGAVLAAQASCNLSRNTSSESFHVLAEVYKRKQDLLGEMQALQKMLSLPSPSSSSSTTTTSPAAVATRSQRQQQFAMENQRRIASIRLQKLEREYQDQNKQQSSLLNTE